MSNLSEHWHEYMDQYIGKEVFSYAEFKDRQGGSKVQLDEDKFSQAKAAKAYSDMKGRLAKAKSEATANRMKKSGGKKRTLSSHRQKDRGGDGGADE
jgi:hypothetical protein